MAKGLAGKSKTEKKSEEETSSKKSEKEGQVNTTYFQATDILELEDPFCTLLTDPSSQPAPVETTENKNTLEAISDKDLLDVNNQPQ